MQERKECVICPKCGFIQEKRPVRSYICNACGGIFDPEDDGQWCVDPTAKIRGIERSRERRG